ncbi:hypothetical protein [Desulfomarina profundi]|uniref:hypothetical protein n=1 Tax=Desulfomarina profundi TaxID=2772557 RepID=UPI0038B2D04A
MGRIIGIFAKLGSVRKSDNRFPARKSRAIRKQQENLPEGVTEISWKTQCRLCTRYLYLIAKGKNANVTKTAVAREIAGFSWAMAQELSKAA